MTNVILIPEKQIILIHPEWSAISTSFTAFFSQTHHLGWCLKSHFSHSLHKNILENINYYTEKRARSPHHGRWPLRYTV